LKKDDEKIKKNFHSARITLEKIFHFLIIFFQAFNPPLDDGIAWNRISRQLQRPENLLLNILPGFSD